MSEDAHLTVLAGAAIYMIAMLVIGIVAARKSVTAEGFFVAGRSMPLWLCSATVMATWIGGGTMLGAAGAAHDGGLLAVIADPPGAALGLFLVGLLVIRTVRRLRLVTVIDFIHQRFGKVVGLLSSVAVAGSSIGWAGALMIAFGHVTYTLTGLPMEWGIIIGGAIMLTYTTAGGMWAVAMTDFVQLAIIIIGLVVLLVAVVADMGGVQAAWAAIPSAKLRLTPVETDPGTWANYLRAWFIIGIANLSSQSLIQRGLSAKTERVAKQSFYIGSIGYLLVGMIPVFLGIMAAEIITLKGDAETIVPQLAVEYLHPVLMAVFVGALLAAIMSSADSAMLSAASIISTNVMPEIIKNPSPERQLKWARIAIPIIGIIGAAIAMKVRSVYGLIMLANVVQLAAVTGPFVVALWWRGATRRGGQAGLAAGVICLVLTNLFWEGLPGDLFGLFVSIFVTVAVSLATRRSDPPRPLLDRNGKPVDTSGLLGWGQSRQG